MNLQNYTKLLFDDIKLELDALQNCDEEQREILLSIIDIKINEVCTILFYEMSKTHREMEEKAKLLKLVARGAVQSDMVSTPQLVIDSISAALQFTSAGLLGVGCFYQPKLFIQLGNVAGTAARGFEGVGKITDSFRQARQYGDQGWYDDTRSSIDQSHESYSQMREQVRKMESAAQNSEEKRHNNLETFTR